MSDIDQVRREDSAMNILNQQLTSISADNQYVSFNLDEEEYGIDVLLVQEIIRYQKPTKVPNANRIIQGVLNFRGKVIPLIDMRAKFGLPVREYDIFTVIIILEIKGKTLGLIVDRVYDIVSIPQEHIQLADEDFMNDLKARFLKGMGKVADRLILLLDPDEVLSFEEFKEVQQISITD
jgi:purine-binding chemotaxis protein CheW